MTDRFASLDTTDAAGGHDDGTDAQGHGFAFTIGRGDEVQTAAIAVDTNQRWDVGAAVDWVRALAPFDPWWVEEPTSPDDVVGHAEIARRIAPIPVATGEHVHNRIMFKQLLQLDAVSFVQLDAARIRHAGRQPRPPRVP
ncbi:enolase C-terminal domain-like protein [Dactylosporangium sp. NBC_01737]|uniref:enolase C-terminal domain-like protein n=1 Tax=Dactylosporangium sp. NBC_01737 TaxID=2975959 RepID=UPI002E0EDA0A